MRQVGHRAVKPQMNAGNGRMLKVADIDRNPRQYFWNPFKRHGANEGVCLYRLPAGNYPRKTPELLLNSSHLGAQPDLDLREPRPHALGIQLAQRHLRY